MAWGIDRPDCVFCGRALTGVDPESVPFIPVCSACEGRPQARLMASADAPVVRPKYLTDGGRTGRDGDD